MDDGNSLKVPCVHCVLLKQALPMLQDAGHGCGLMRLFLSACGSSCCGWGRRGDSCPQRHCCCSAASIGHAGGVLPSRVSHNELRSNLHPNPSQGEADAGGVGEAPAATPAPAAAAAPEAPVPAKPPADAAMEDVDDELQRALQMSLAVRPPRSIPASFSVAEMLDTVV